MISPNPLLSNSGASPHPCCLMNSSGKEIIALSLVSGIALAAIAIGVVALAAAQGCPLGAFHTLSILGEGAIILIEAGIFVLSCVALYLLNKFFDDLQIKRDFKLKVDHLGWEGIHDIWDFIPTREDRAMLESKKEAILFNYESFNAKYNLTGGGTAPHKFMTLAFSDTDLFCILFKENNGLALFIYQKNSPHIDLKLTEIAALGEMYPALTYNPPGS